MRHDTQHWFRDLTDPPRVAVAPSGNVLVTVGGGLFSDTVTLSLSRSHAHGLLEELETALRQLEHEQATA